jgi:hypothetical protein
MPCNRKRGRVVEGSSLENCRRCEPFVSSNLTASAKTLKKSPTCWGFFSSPHRRNVKIRVHRRPLESICIFLFEVGRAVGRYESEERGRKVGTPMSYTINKLSEIKLRSVTRPGLYGDRGGL